MTRRAEPPSGVNVATITIFLLDDHELVRDGLRALFQPEPDLEVIGEAATAEDAVREIVALRPDVAIIDVRLPDGDGVSVCRDVRSSAPEVRCLMLTSFADDEALLGSVLAGAAGYVLKQVKGNDLVDAVRRVGKGESLLDGTTTTRVLDRLRSEWTTDGGLGQLSEQERRILHLIAQGHTNRQIADEVDLAEKTVKNYVSNVLAKLGMARRSEAAAYAARLEERHRRSAT